MRARRRLLAGVAGLWVGLAGLAVGAAGPAAEPFPAGYGAAYAPDWQGPALEPRDVPQRVLEALLPQPKAKPKPAPIKESPRPVPASSGGSTGRCGGDLPPCWVMRRESGPNGDPNAFNPTGCHGRGCYGKWQCDPRTCDGTGTEAEQDAEARRVWDGGRGCRHWDAC